MHRLCCVEEFLFGALADGEDFLPIRTFAPGEFPEDLPRFPESSCPCPGLYPVGRSCPVIFLCGDTKLLPDLFLGLRGFEFPGVLCRPGLLAGAGFVPRSRHVFLLDGREL